MALGLRAATTMLLPLVLVGCSGEWVHPAKSPDQFAIDDATCLQDAIAKVQFTAQKEDAPKWMERALGTKTYTVDGNESLRQRWHKSCLRINGWTYRSSGSRPSVTNTELFGSAFRYISQ